MDGLAIFDLDGTLYRGDAPFQFFAETLAQHLSSDDGPCYLEQVKRHLTGEPGLVAGDNWEAVVQLAMPFVTREESYQEAFSRTRQFMLSDSCVLRVPELLRQFLHRAKGQVLLAVATNSPAEVAFPLLKKLDLVNSFDIVRTQAGKPEGLVRLVEEVGLQQHWPTGRVMSIGDNYRNDIWPGVDRGWTTAHISPRGYFPGPATFRGRVIEEILPSAANWIEESR